jgi:hypothetical protein
MSDFSISSKWILVGEGGGDHASAPLPNCSTKLRKIRKYTKY